MSRNVAEYRAARATELALRGMTYQEIADELGVRDRSGAWRAVRRCLNRRQQVAADNYVAASFAELKILIDLPGSQWRNRHSGLVRRYSMKLSRSLVALLGVGFLGLASIGAGTGATFTDQTKTAQTIKAGTLNVVVEAPNASPFQGKTITLPAVGPVGSTFDSTPVPVTIRNLGDITANPIWLGLDVAASGNANDNALRAQVYVCITSPNPTPSIIFNGPLTTLAAGRGDRAAHGRRRQRRRGGDGATVSGQTALPTSTRLSSTQAWSPPPSTTRGAVPGWRPAISR